MSFKLVNQASVSRSGEGQTLPRVGRVRVSSGETGGAFEVIELGTPPGGGGPPAHIHQDHDECFYVIHGTYTFVLGNQQVEVSPGTITFVPRGTPHSFKASDGARAIVFVIPAGMEGFFRDLGAGMLAGRPDAELRAELASKYDSHPVD